MSTTDAEKVRASFNLGVTLLEISLDELKTFSLSEFKQLDADSLRNALQVIEQIINCDKELREYLNAVGGRKRSKKVRELIEALLISVEKLSEAELPDNSPIPQYVDKIKVDLQKVEVACPPGTC